MAATSTTRMATPSCSAANGTPMTAPTASTVASRGATSVAERLGVTTVATVDRRDFTVVRPAHVDAFTLVP